MKLTPGLAAAAVVTTAVLAGGGGAVAGSMITGAQIKDSTITTADVKNGTLLKADLSSSTVKALSGKPGPRGLRGTAGPQGTTGADGATGPTGADGAVGQTGPTGQTGATGPAGVSGYEIVVGSKPLQAGSTGQTLVVSCPTGKKVVGAGAYWTVSNVGVPLVISADSVGTTVDNPRGAGGPDTVVVKVVCAFAG